MNVDKQSPTTKEFLFVALAGLSLHVFLFCLTCGIHHFLAWSLTSTETARNAFLWNEGYILGSVSLTLLITFIAIPIILHITIHIWQKLQSSQAE